MFVQAKAAERIEARRLRAQGMSVKRIAQEIGVSSSSVSLWVRDVALPIRPAPPPRTVGRPRSGPVEEGPGKTCGRCRRELTLSSFNRSASGYQHWCRDCFSDYFQQRGTLHLAQVKRAKQARIATAAWLVRERLENSVCRDCGESELAVLEFDHIGAKRDSIASMVRNEAPLPDLLAEMDQCEIVCACCHRRRTARRAGWARLTDLIPDHWSTTHRRNFSHVMSVLRFEGCVDCGERDPVVLEFDHVGAKEARVAALIITATPERLKREIAQCEVRCCNCHRLVTYLRRGGYGGSIRIGPPRWANFAAAPVV